MKKFLAIILAALTLLCLVSCADNGSGGNESNGGGNKPSDSATSKYVFKVESKNGYEIKIVGGFWKSLLHYTSRPDIILVTPNEKYMIRFVTCRARKRFYQFVTPEYYAKYMKLHFAFLALFGQTLIHSPQSIQRS